MMKNVFVLTKEVLKRFVLLTGPSVNKAKAMAARNRVVGSERERLIY